jgi:hypothetical protein
MIFMSCLAFLGWANLIPVLRSFTQGGKPSPLSILHFLAATGIAVGFFFGLLLTDEPQGLNATNWSVWGFFAGGALTFLAFSIYVCRAARDQTRARGVAFGMSVWACLAGLYMVGTTLDHWYFFRGNNAGIGSAEGLGAKDVQCDRVLLVRIGETSATYRCPTLEVFGPPINRPFVPWPDYHQGNSVELKLAIDNLTKSAVKLDTNPGK